jgi:hypothetical protein
LNACVSAGDGQAALLEKWTSVSTVAAGFGRAAFMAGARLAGSSRVRKSHTSPSLQECIAEAAKDKTTDEYTQERLRELYKFFETTSTLYFVWCLRRS